MFHIARRCRRLIPVLILLLLITLCAGVAVWADGSLRVISTKPENGATGVREDTVITVTFNEDLDERASRLELITLKDAQGKAVGINCWISYRTLTIEPSYNPMYQNLAFNTRYTVHIPKDAVSAKSGDRLAADYTFSFTTRENPAPEVTATDPANNASNVPVDKTVTVTFSKNVVGSVKYYQITLKDTNNNDVAFTKSISGDTLTIDPKQNLAFSTAYTVTIPKWAVESDTGAATEETLLQDDYSFSFTTTSDRVAPRVTGTDPNNGTTGVPVDKTVSITFSEYIQAGANYGGITVTPQGGSPVSIGKNITGSTLTLDPNQELAYATAYTVTVPAGAVKDLAGNQLAAGYTFCFSTEAPPDTKPPTVTADPKGGLYNALQSVTLTASEPSTIYYTTDGGDPTTGSAKYTDPISISADTTLKFMAVDQAGNHSVIYTETYTIDTDPPTVRSTDPAEGATGVPVDKTVTVTFSEGIQAGANYGGITVTPQGGGPISIGTSISGKVMTIDPAGNLSYGVSYTVYIPAGAVKDAAGNVLANACTFSFTTRTSGGGGGGGGGGGAADTTPPRVTGTDPPNNATGVKVNKTVTVTFSENVQAGSKYDQIVLKDALGNAVACGKSISGKVLTIDPAADLSYNVHYTVSIPAAAVKDTAGNALAGEYTFGFTTEALTPAPAPPAFTDMDGHWAEETVNDLVYWGIISGYPDGTFRPDQPITRLEAACILVRALKVAPGTKQDLDKFKDAARIPAWALGDAAGAAREGLIKGYPHWDGSLTFEPSKLITRTEEAAILSRVLEKELGQITPAPLTFTDSGKIPAWAKIAVAVAVTEGVVSGYPDNTFRPQNHVTRAEVASMIWRLFKQIHAQ
ncbi:MAG: Ig-like domain-containing protein [Bacillota bacterium]